MFGVRVATCLMVVINGRGVVTILGIGEVNLTREVIGWRVSGRSGAPFTTVIGVALSAI